MQSAPTARKIVAFIVKARIQFLDTARYRIVSVILFAQAHRRLPQFLDWLDKEATPVSGLAGQVDGVISWYYFYCLGKLKLLFPINVPFP